MFGLVRSGRRCDGGTWSPVGLLRVRTARLSVSPLVPRVKVVPDAGLTVFTFISLVIIYLILKFDQ